MIALLAAFLITAPQGGELDWDTAVLCSVASNLAAETATGAAAEDYRAAATAYAQAADRLATAQGRDTGEQTSIYQAMFRDEGNRAALTAAAGLCLSRVDDIPGD